MAERSTVAQDCKPLPTEILVDVIIPVHNASDTIAETVRSAMHQVIPGHLRPFFCRITSRMSLYVCCYDDGSTDDSWKILCDLEQRSTEELHNQDDGHPPDRIPSKLLIAKGPEGLPGRGAGYARNRAVGLRYQHFPEYTSVNDSADQLQREEFLCLLDSDDIMHETRVAEQIYGMMSLAPDQRQRMLMGCRIRRDPPDATWHYTQWANQLTEDRLYLERFREITVLQPTWMMRRSRFEELDGYIEAPPLETVDHPDVASVVEPQQSAIGTLSCQESTPIFRLVHPTFDTPHTLQLAEDLRFFHAHLEENGLLRVCQANDPNIALVTYRHRANQSQSFRTSRKLLMHLRVYAFEQCVLNNKGIPKSNDGQRDPWNRNNQHRGAFVVWGAGRDGKEFVKALSAENRRRVYCFVDVDRKKIDQGYYVNQDERLKIPIVHFSLLAPNPELRQQLFIEFKQVEGDGDTENLTSKPCYGRIDKTKPTKCTLLLGESGVSCAGDAPKRKRQKLNGNAVMKEVVPALSSVLETIDLTALSELPVVVCVAMYRTSGALERNVTAIGRSEGVDLWHFS